MPFWMLSAHYQYDFTLYTFTIMAFHKATLVGWCKAGKSEIAGGGGMCNNLSKY